MTITCNGQKLKVIRWSNAERWYDEDLVLVEILGEKRRNFSRFTIPLKDLKKVQATLIKKWPAWTTITLA
jgi:hypothetical protein